jgi:hypothetical protein
MRPHQEVIVSLSANLNFQFHDGTLCLTAAGVEMRLIWDPKPQAEMRLGGGDLLTQGNPIDNVT